MDVIDDTTKARWTDTLNVSGADAFGDVSHDEIDRAIIAAFIGGGSEGSSQCVETMARAMASRGGHQSAEHEGDGVDLMSLRFVFAGLRVGDDGGFIADPRSTVLRQEDQVRMFRVVGLRAFG